MIMGLTKTGHADKAGILQELRQQLGYEHEHESGDRLQRDRQRASGRVEGLAWAIRLIEAWQLPGPETLAQAMANLQSKLDGGTPGPAAWDTFARQIWADMNEILGDPVPGEDLGDPLPQTPLEHLRRVSPEAADWASRTGAGQARHWHGISSVVGHYAEDCPGPVMCEYAPKDGGPTGERPAHRLLTSSPSSEAHEHNHEGMTLRHSHPGGRMAHGYFGHPEDGGGGDDV